MLAAGVLIASLASGVMLLGRYVWVRALAADLSGAWQGTDGTVSMTLSLLGDRHRFAGHCWVTWPEGRAEGTARGWCDYLGRVRLTVEAPHAPALQFRGRVTATRRIVGNFVGRARSPAPLRLRGVPTDVVARTTQRFASPAHGRPHDRTSRPV